MGSPSSGAGAGGSLDLQPEAFGVEAWTRQDALADLGQVGPLPVLEPDFAGGEGEEGFEEASPAPGLRPGASRQWIATPPESMGRRGRLVPGCVPA